MKFNIGDRVVLNGYYKNVGYITVRGHYTNMYTNKKGTVICYSETGKKSLFNITLNPLNE